MVAAPAQSFFRSDDSIIAYTTVQYQLLISPAAPIYRSIFSKLSTVNTKMAVLLHAFVCITQLCFDDAAWQNAKQHC